MKQVNKSVLIVCMAGVCILAGGYLVYQGRVKEEHVAEQAILPTEKKVEEVKPATEVIKKETESVATEEGLTEAEKVEDFEYLYRTIVENYPYIEMNKRVNGVDWKSLQSEYLNQVKSATTDMKFYTVLYQYVAQLNNLHTHMLAETEVPYIREVFYYAKQDGVWQGMNFDTLNQPVVLKRYGLSEELTMPEQPSGDGQEQQPQEVIVNASVGDIVEGKVACITIPQMISMWQIEGDKQLINDYLMKVKDYPALVIDIRGNTGGDSRYWAEYLLPQIIGKEYSATTYNFYKDGEYIRKFFEADGRAVDTVKKVADLESAKLPKLPPEIKESFTYYDEDQMVIRPAADSIKFRGNVYLLVDDAVYSSAEMLAVFAKESGFATLIGSVTGGGGIGSDPIFAALPNSGYILRFAKEMGTTGDGACNEEYETAPDYEVESTLRSANQADDLCIQKVLELEGK